MPRQSPHVVQISFFSDPQGRTPAQLLQAWPTLVDVAEAGWRAGVRISIVQAAVHSERLERGGVPYHFLPFAAAAAGEPGRLAGLLRSLAPDLIHVHGLGFPRDVLGLATLAPGVPIILQDHADRPPPIWRRPLWRRALALAAGISFCAREQAQPFVNVGLVRADTPLYEIPESTSRFTPGNQQEARRASRVSGAPLVLWVGHLDDNKDPLTVLAGVSAAAHALPGLQLWCCFGTAPLLREVRSRIKTDRMLRDRVHLLGCVPHERVEQLMRAADVFVLGSHRESTGYALIEALACGVSPVVTDIPSFRSLTGAGTVGRLWPCDEPHALCEALKSVMARTDSTTRATVRAHFERELSFDSLGAKLATMYQEVLERARRHCGVAGPLPNDTVLGAP